jgi:hypothetical protein
MKFFTLFVVIFTLTLNLSSYALADKPIPDKELQRGCCIFQVQGESKCAPATLGYCRQKAERANTEFTFKASAKCSAVPVCLAQTKPVEQ